MAPEMLGLILRQGGNADKSDFVGDQLERPGDYLELGHIPRPVPGPGQVLIKVRRAAVNPSDMAFIQGFYGQERVARPACGFRRRGEGR